MRSLKEWIEVGGPQTTHAPHLELACDNWTAAWSGLPYAELSVVLVHLRFLAMLHQTHHWVARGDTFYGDHELFQLLYQRTAEDIDEVAEKAVGLGSERNVALDAQLSQILCLNKVVSSPQTVPCSSDLARASLVAERNFLQVLNAMYDSLQQAAAGTMGVDNMLSQVADRHERHVYLLSRRSSPAPLGI